MRMEKCKNAKAQTKTQTKTQTKAALIAVFGEWKETIKSRPLLTAAVVVIFAVLTVRGVGRYVDVGPVYDNGADNVFTEEQISEGESICISGRVKDIREKKSFGGKNYTVIISNPKYNGEMLAGKGRYVYAYLEKTEGVRIGSEVELQGKLDYFNHARNHGEFDSYAYYSGRGFLFALRDASVTYMGEKYDKLSDGLYRVRQSLSEDMTRKKIRCIYLK